MAFNQHMQTIQNSKLLFLLSKTVIDNFIKLQNIKQP